MKAILFCGLVALIQVSQCFPDETRAKREDKDVFKVIAELADQLDETKHELIEHIHEHVETKLNNNGEILMELRNNQRQMMLCKMNGDPCSNGGSCYLDEETDQYACACPVEWKGFHCEEYDQCHDVHCENDGECVNGTCMCTDSFTGWRCETAFCAQELERYHAIVAPPGMEQPRCEEDGTYAPYQYRGSQAVCVTKGTGHYLGYSMDRWAPEHLTMDCECAREEHERHLTHQPVDFECLPDGSFNKSV